MLQMLQMLQWSLKKTTATHRTRIETIPEQQEP